MIASALIVADRHPLARMRRGAGSTAVDVPTRRSTLISTADVRLATDLVRALILTGETPGTHAKGEPFFTYLDRHLATGTPPAQAAVAAAESVRLFNTDPDSANLARNLARMVDAIIDRDLLGMTIPTERDQAFAVNLALLNDRPLPA